MDDLTWNEPLKGVSVHSPGWSAAEPGGQAKRVGTLEEGDGELEPVSVAPLRGLIEGRPNFSPGSATLHPALRSAVPSGLKLSRNRPSSATLRSSILSSVSACKEN